MIDVPGYRPAHQSTESLPVTAWLGWVLFIAIIMFGAGLINLAQGLVALFDDDLYPVSRSAVMVDAYFAAWGWALVVLGAALMVAALGIVVGYGWARAAGVVVAVVSTLVNIGFAGAYPAWAVLAVSFDIVAIYALVMHGGEAKLLRGGAR
jgi:hypothetical protein